MAARHQPMFEAPFRSANDLPSSKKDAAASSSAPSSTKGAKWSALKWALKFTASSPEPPPDENLQLPRVYIPPEVQYHQCFKELDHLRQLLDEVSSRSNSLTALLEREGESGGTGVRGDLVASVGDVPAAASSCLDDSYSAGAESAVQPPSVKPYQEFLDMFISLFLHSDFLTFLGGVSADIDPFSIISSFVKKNCPDTTIFRRVCVSPKYIASQIPDSHDTNIYKNIPVNQLARFCDLAVLRFLSTVTEHTSRESVIWALEYLYNLLDSLHASLTRLNSYGWYGAPPLRTRKGTAMGRQSITYAFPPTPAQLQSASAFGAPPVVIVGTPPISPSHTYSTSPSPEPNFDRYGTSFLDPETGQVSPALSSGGAAGISLAGKRGRDSFPPTSSDSPFRRRQRRISREEFHGGGILKPPLEHHHHHPSPPRIHPSHSWGEGGGGHITPTSPLSPSSSISPADSLGEIRAPPPPPAVHLPSPSRQSMQSIPEEDDRDLSLTLSVPRGADSPTPGGAPQARSSPEAIEFNSPPPPSSFSEINHLGSPPSRDRATRSRSPPSVASQLLGVIREETDNGSPSSKSAAVAVPPRSDIRSPSPGLSGVISPTSSCSSIGEEEEVRSKPLGASIKPPDPKDIPRVNIQMELDTLMNGEGRISLLAILHAVSRLPQTQELWLGNMGEKCFTIIQLCMDLGLRMSAGDDTLPKPPPPSSTTSAVVAPGGPPLSGQDRRKQFQSQKNPAFHEHTTTEEKPSKTHSQYVVEFSVRALIRCATSLIVGCTSEPNLCKLRHVHLPDQSISTYNTLTRLLKRVYTFSPLRFRQALCDFAKPSGSSCRRLFQFLHIMLQYCAQPLDGGRVNVFLVTIVSAVLRETVDRLAQLDITEASIQNSIVSEACGFFQYAQQLFVSDSLAENLRFQHLHMYIHRIALSVILPPRPRPQDRKQFGGLPTTSPAAGESTPNTQKTALSADRGLSEATPTKMATPTKVGAAGRPASRKLLKQATFAIGFSSTPGGSSSNGGGQEKPRPRSESLDLPSPASLTPTESKGAGHQSGGKSRRAQWTKQQSVHSDPSSSIVAAAGSGGGGSDMVDDLGRRDVGGEREWRGLNLTLLRSRIQRLMVVMNASEPGSIPNAGMLASLVDLGGKSSVVSRAMVFLECALFVNKLASDSPTVWMEQNRDSPLVYNVTKNIHKWGEAIADRMRIVELKERDILLRLTEGKTDTEQSPACLPEEPIFPDEQDTSLDATAGESKDNLQTISYAIKMSACILLLEITRFLRNPPDHFVNVGTSISQVSTPRVSVTNIDRKISNASIVSTDTEAMGVGGGGILRGATGSLGRPPRLGHFGSSLSVEDAEGSAFDNYYGRSVSIEEGAGVGVGSSSPKKKRASVYLRVTATGGTSGGVSRTTSIRKQPRMVHLGSSTTSDHHGSLNQRSPNAGRRPRKSAALHTSFYTGTRSRRPSHVGSTTVGSYHPVPPKYRRKSVGAAVFSKEREVIHDNEFPPTFTSSQQHHIAPAPSPTKASPSSSFLSSTSISFGQKLRRSAQRAFRRGHRSNSKRLHSESALSPSSSPGPAPRKRLMSGRRPSIGASSIAQSIGLHLLTPEESRKKFPWLDIVEHLVLADSTNPEARVRHAQTCKALTAALNMIYSSTYEQENEENQTDGNKRTSASALPKKSMSRSLSTLFAQQLSLAESDLDTSPPAVRPGRFSQAPRSTSLPSVRRRTLQKSRSITAVRLISVPSTISSVSASLPSSSVSDPLARLSFANMNYAQFTSSFLVATAPGSSEGGIELFLEEESSYPRPYLLAELDRQRREYVRNEYQGLLHAPLSVLIHAAPILHENTFTVLKSVVWDLLLDSDPELAKTAAVFFLLIGAKETEKVMEGFIQEQISWAAVATDRGHWDAIRRFKVLWDSRYHVWPRMEERAQKTFNANSDSEDGKREDKQQTIGYSLPANLLGHSGSSPPFPPWEPASVCTNKSCDSNPAKCYHHTRLAPIVHGEEISEKVQTFNVSGVSMPQEASSKPANVYLGFESEEQDGNIEYWEAVEPTLFPHSLFPLTRFVVMSLSPPRGHRRHGPPPHYPPQDSHNSSSVGVSELARQIVWDCMVEDPRLFFRTLLNQFNRLVADPKCKSSHLDQLLAETLEPLHVLLQAFTTLPPSAAHNLFNNFVGVIMRHTDQPFIHSHKIVQSVLTLITMVVPSVQGLDSKVLKGILKKESCYTAIMTTARIRGVDRVCLVTDPTQIVGYSYQVTDDMTFGHLISEVSRTKPSELEFYLVDRNKGSDVPVLSSLVIQDEYSMPLDGHYPTFELCHVDNQKLWSQQIEQLFVFKMSEVMRVLFMMQLLLTGPEVEQGFTYSEYAHPNYRFIHNELVQLNSFPRKALTSILYEAGPGALQRFQLKISDIMLKTIWVKFVLQLFKSIKPEFDWSNSLILFLNVINGALLLHSEDSNILKFCLASLLMAATKFGSIFKKDGYLMIVPTLIQVYALHIRNRLITEALKFTWAHFFLLDGYVFYLQVTAATATLVSEEAAFLSRNITSTFAATGLTSSRLSQMEQGEARRLLVRAVHELTNALDIEPTAFPPPDELGIRSCCLENLEDSELQTKLELDSKSSKLQDRLSPEGWQKMTLLNAANLCISLARWDPEALRGMQVLIFLDSLMAKFLEAFGSAGYYKSMLNAIEYLIKGCHSITKLQPWKGDVLTTRKNREKGGAEPDAQNQPTTVTKEPTTRGEALVHSHSDEESATIKKRNAPTRKTSMANAFHNLKLLVNPSKKDISERVSLAETEGAAHGPRQRKRSAATPGLPVHQLGKDFKSRRIHDVHQRIIRLSRDSLLSLATQFVMHYSGELQLERRRSSATANTKPEKIKVHLDQQSVSHLTSVAVQLLKQGSASDEVLQLKGLNVFMTQLLPSIDWTDQYYPSFNNILSRLLKLFKYLQRANRALTTWDNLSGFLAGVTQCIHKHPHLVLGQDQHLTKLRMLLESIVSMHTGGAGGGGGGGQQHLQKKWYIKSIQRPLLASAPSSFTDAIVGLAAELIVVTQSQQQPKFRYCAEDILRHMPHREMKTHEEQLLTKILLPLCIQLGLRSDVVQPSRGDANYMIKLVDSKVEILLKFPGQKFSPEQFFRTFKVICCTFGEIFTAQDWHKVARWILSLGRTRITSPASSSSSKPAPSAKKISTTSITSQESGGRSSRLSSTSSANSSVNATKLDNYISFHESLLGFYESFVIVYRVPVFSLLWPLLNQLQPQLQITLQGVKSDNPAQFERVNLCIERCQRLGRTGFGVAAAKTKQQLLREIQEELKIVSQEEMTRSFSQVGGYRPTLIRSRTSVEGGRPTKISKRRMSTPYISPLTMIGEEDLSSEAGSATLPRHLEQRPKTLAVRGRAMTTGSALPFAGKTAATSATVGTNPPPPISTATATTKKASFANELATINGSRANRSPSPRRSPRRQHINERRSGSPDLDIVRSKSPAKSPRGRAPKLGVLGKFGSSGFYGDNEDDDDDGGIVQPSKVTIQLPGEDGGVEEIIVPNLGAVSAGSSPLQIKKQAAAGSGGGMVSNGGQIAIPNLGAVSAGNSPLQLKKQTGNGTSSNQVIITAEVHENSDYYFEETSKNSLTARVTFSEDGSTTPLLPSPEARRSNIKKGRAVSPSLSKKKDLYSFRAASPSESRASKSVNVRKGSLSLDRKRISGVKELNSSLQESSKFMYRSFEDGGMGYSQ